MLTKKYRTSFTTGGLYFREAVKIAELYLSVQDWQSLREKIINENYLQARTESSLKRTTNEVIQRLHTLTLDQINLLVEGNLSDQKQVLWLAVCKHYELIRGFATQVIREKFLRLDPKLDFVDWDVFFNAKAEWDADLEHLTYSTKDKLRQVLFRMLREAEILSENNTIQPVVLSPRLSDLIKKEDSELLLIYPTMANF